MRTSVSFPPSAARALGFLKSHHNDVEIFVEDTATPNMWVNLLRHYLPPGVKLNSVNPLGSRDSVVRACAEDQQNDHRKKLYIIDADLDLLRNSAKPRLKHLYRLRAYCIENYLLDEQAFLAAITATDAQVDWLSANHKLDFNGWLNRNRNNLVRLFICYAVTYELGRQNRTIGYSVHELVGPVRSNCDLRDDLVYRRIIALYRSLRTQCSKTEVREVFDRVNHRAQCQNSIDFVSAKDYIFPHLYKIIRAEFDVRLNPESLKTLVARCLSKTFDPYLLRRIRRVCR